MGYTLLTGFFVDKAFEVVAHAEAVEVGVAFVVTLLEPGEELDQAGEQGDEPGIVAAAKLGLGHHAGPNDTLLWTPYLDHLLPFSPTSGASGPLGCVAGPAG